MLNSCPLFLKKVFIPKTIAGEKIDKAQYLATENGGNRCALIFTLS